MIRLGAKKGCNVLTGFDNVALNRTMNPKIQLQRNVAYEQLIQPSRVPNRTVYPDNRSLVQGRHPET